MLVGKYQKRFTAHNDLICAKSTFFRAALSNDWKEARERIVRLPDENAKMFATYLRWVYTNAIAEVDGTPYLDTDREAHGQDVWRTYIDLWALADRLGDYTLKNRVTDEIVVLSDRQQVLPSMSNIHQAYNSTPANSSVRRLFVDFYICCTSAEVAQEGKGKLPREFLEDIAVAVIGKGDSFKNDIPVPETSKRYHETGRADYL